MKSHKIKSHWNIPTLKLEKWACMWRWRECRRSGDAEQGSSKCGLWITAGPWRPFQGGLLKVKIMFLVILSHYLLFFLSFSRECLMEFSRDSMICDNSNRSNGKASMRTQLSSIKPYIKEIYKNVKQCHSSHQFFWILENKFFFKINLYYLC